MKLTQSQIIVKLLESRKDWTPSYELIKASTQWGWIGSQGDRRARELAESGQIEVRHIGKYAEYRAKQVVSEPPRYRPDFIKRIVEEKGRELQASFNF